jgi:hypothetical protein
MNNIINIFYDPEWDCYGVEYKEGFYKASKEDLQRILGELLGLSEEVFERMRGDYDEA